MDRSPIARARSARPSVLLALATILVLGVLARMLGGDLGVRPVAAAAPDVREVDPAGISINGSAGDWDQASQDFLADMYQAGKPDKDVLSKLYARYECSSETMFVYVKTVSGWNIVPSDGDNYVKDNDAKKLVDGSSGTSGGPPDFAYVGNSAWEASFHRNPGDHDLNVHAEVTAAKSETSAVAERSLKVTIDCSEPTPRPTERPTPEPTPEPTERPTPEPTAQPTPEPTPEPTAQPTPEPTPEPTAQPTAEPELTGAPSAQPTPGLTIVPIVSPEPSAEPSPEPSASAAPESSAEPSDVPELSPEPEPSAVPIVSPEPSAEPTQEPVTTSVPSPEVPPSPAVSQPPVPPVSPGPTEAVGAASAEPSQPVGTPGASLQPPPDTTPEATSGPVEAPPSEVIPAPIIVAKVTDQGTATLRDNRLLRGATFAIHTDDGDRTYEPESDELVWAGTASSGFLVFPAAPEGDYWVVETDAPTGFHTAPPVLIRHELTEEPRDCLAVGERRSCVPDDDESGGFLLVYVHDTPADLPRTDRSEPR